MSLSLVLTVCFISIKCPYLPVKKEVMQEFEESFVQELDSGPAGDEGNKENEPASSVQPKPKPKAKPKAKPKVCRKRQIENLCSAEVEKTEGEGGEANDKEAEHGLHAQKIDRAYVVFWSQTFPPIVFNLLHTVILNF